LGRSDLRRSHHLKGATYTGGPSAQFKAFEDASAHAVMTQGHGWKHKIAAGFTNLGSRSGDKLATLIQLALFAARPGMHWINLGLPPANHSSTGSEAEMNRPTSGWVRVHNPTPTKVPTLLRPRQTLPRRVISGWRVAQVTLQFARGRAVLEADVRDTVVVPEPATPSDCPLAGGLSN